MLDCLQSNITRPHQVLLEVGYGNFFSSPGVNDHHARVVRGGDGQGEGGGAPGGGVGKFFTSFNEETRSTAPRAPLICPSLNLYPWWGEEERGRISFFSRHWLLGRDKDFEIGVGIRIGD